MILERKNTVALLLTRTRQIDVGKVREAMRVFRSFDISRMFDHHGVDGPSTKSSHVSISLRLFRIKVFYFMHTLTVCRSKFGSDHRNNIDIAFSQLLNNHQEEKKTNLNDA